MASHKMPLTRVQSKRRIRRQRRLALIPLFCLFAAFMLAVMVNGTMGEAYGTGTGTPVARASVDDLESATVSRSSARSEINHGTWELGNTIDPTHLGAIPAKKPDRLPAGQRARPQSDPQRLRPGSCGRRHGQRLLVQSMHLVGIQATPRTEPARRQPHGRRRHVGGQRPRARLLGGPHAARRRRDGVPTRPGWGSLLYGHVAVVEQVHADGSITTSECGAALGGKPFSRTFTKPQAAQHEYVHY